MPSFPLWWRCFSFTSYWKHKWETLQSCVYSTGLASCLGTMTDLLLEGQCCVSAASGLWSPPSLPPVFLTKKNASYRSWHPCPSVRWWKFSSISILLFSFILLICFTRHYLPSPQRKTMSCLRRTDNCLGLFLQGNPFVLSSTFYPFWLKAGKVLCEGLCSNWLINMAVTQGKI